MKWREDVLADFSTALAECATVELNRWSVPGAQHGHYITLAMSVGELVAHEMKNLQTIEQMILEDRAEKQMQAARETQSKPN